MQNAKGFLFFYKKYINGAEKVWINKDFKKERESVRIFTVFQ